VLLLSPSPRRRHGAIPLPPSLLTEAQGCLLRTAEPGSTLADDATARELGAHITEGSSGRVAGEAQVNAVSAGELVLLSW
jgi:hypothetical protein